MAMLEASTRRRRQGRCGACSEGLRSLPPAKAPGAVWWSARVVPRTVRRGGGVLGAVDERQPAALPAHYRLLPKLKRSCRARACNNCWSVGIKKRKWWKLWN